MFYVCYVFTHPGVGFAVPRHTLYSETLFSTDGCQEILMNAHHLTSGSTLIFWAAAIVPPLFLRNNSPLPFPLFVFFRYAERIAYSPEQSKMEKVPGIYGC